MLSLRKIENGATTSENFLKISGSIFFFLALAGGSSGYPSRTPRSLRTNGGEALC